MKKKRRFAIFSIAMVCILVSVFALYLSNNKRDINKLITQLEDAINEHDIKEIIELYPDYCRDDVSKRLSQNKLDEFYNNVIEKDSKKINIQILGVTNFNNLSCGDIHEQILNDYGLNIAVDDYQLVQIKYHNDFGESSLQVVKIRGSYYLYVDAFFLNRSVISSYEVSGIKEYIQNLVEINQTY